MRNKSLVKKIVATGLAASLLLTALTGCGKDASDTSASGNSDKVTVVKVGSRYDDVEIWEAVNEKLKDENISCKVTGLAERLVIGLGHAPLTVRR